MAAVLVTAAGPAGANPPPTDTTWISGTAGPWSDASNWDSGVPTSTVNAYISTTGGTISLGASAQAKTLFVQGPIGGESQLNSGTVSLSDQLWIDANGGTILRLFDGGSAPVSVTANKSTLSASPTNQGGLILDSRPGGNVTFTVTDTLTIGYDGSGSYVYTQPLIPSAAGAASISATTIETSVLATAGQSDWNYVGTYSAGATLSATNLNLGVAGDLGGADNYGGTWNVTNTALGVQSTSGGNYLTITDGGTYTNTGTFIVGVSGTGNEVFVGYTGYASNTGALQVTGTSDLIIGAAGTADGNRITVDLGGVLSVNKNVIVGADGHSNELVVDHGGSVSSAGARLGANAGSGGNSVTVQNGATWTTNGTIRVGSSGTGNVFAILSGGTVTLTGAGKNFFVGYDKSASGNTLTVSGSGSTLSMQATGADLVVSANQGAGADATGNVLGVYDGGLLDVNRTLVGAGGTLTGNGGTVGGDTYVGAGGHLAPGTLAGGPGTAGAVTFLGNLDLGTGGGTFDVTVSGTTSDVIDVAGSLTLGGSSTLAVTAGGGTPPGFAYIIAHYGTLAGMFGSVTGLSAGWIIDYNFHGLNTIAIVAQVPEIGSASAAAALALVVGSLGLLERRRLRRRTA